MPSNIHTAITITKSVQIDYAAIEAAIAQSYRRNPLTWNENYPGNPTTYKAVLCGGKKRQNHTTLVSLEPHPEMIVRHGEYFLGSDRREWIHRQGKSIQERNYYRTSKKHALRVQEMRIDEAFCKQLKEIGDAISPSDYAPFDDFEIDNDI